MGAIFRVFFYNIIYVHCHIVYIYILYYAICTISARVFMSLWLSVFLCIFLKVFHLIALPPLQGDFTVLVNSK